MLRILVLIRFRIRASRKSPLGIGVGRGTKPVDPGTPWHLLLFGPPGTGKSQTIANMIAQLLAHRKSVLFVAEKTAALDVVYRRLTQHRLNDCCVELHSSKAERKKFLEQLDRSWTNNRRKKKNTWTSVSSELLIKRDQLNEYVEAIHRIHSNGWTTSVDWPLPFVIAVKN